MSEVYEYYAVFTYEPEGITITFPDLPGCLSCGYSTDEAIRMAREALHLYLEDMNESDIPNPREATEIVLDDSSQKLFKITVAMNR